MIWSCFKFPINHTNILTRTLWLFLVCNCYLLVMLGILPGVVCMITLNIVRGDIFIQSVPLQILTNAECFFPVSPLYYFGHSSPIKLGCSWKITEPITILKLWVWFTFVSSVYSIKLCDSGLQFSLPIQLPLHHI